MCISLLLLPIHLTCCSFYSCQPSLSTRQPEYHLHGAVKLDSSGKLSACLLWTAYPIIQDAETAMAVGKKWTHAQFVSKGEGLLVLVCNGLDLWRLTMRGDLAKET